MPQKVNAQNGEADCSLNILPVKSSAAQLEREAAAALTENPLTVGCFQTHSKRLLAGLVRKNAEC
jgi:hypothetical protein